MTQLGRKICNYCTSLEDFTRRCIQHGHDQATLFEDEELKQHDEALLREGFEAARRVKGEKFLDLMDFKRGGRAAFFDFADFLEARGKR